MAFFARWVSGMRRLSPFPSAQSHLLMAGPDITAMTQGRPQSFLRISSRGARSLRTSDGNSGLLTPSSHCLRNRTWSSKAPHVS
jgi:hypothetical protein